MAEFPTDIIAAPPQLNRRINVRKLGENHARTRFAIIEKKFLPPLFQEEEYVHVGRST
jgi:hypothetical protein